MGIDTKIYCNHNLKLAGEQSEISDLLQQTLGNSIVIKEFSKKEIESTNGSIQKYMLFLNPNSITFELPKFNHITIITNFEYSGFIRLYDKTVCFSPVGIQRYHTNMKLYFASEWSEQLNINKEHFLGLSNAWKNFKKFMYDVSIRIGASKYIYINDGFFSGIEEIAWNGGSIEEMKKSANLILKNCESIEEYYATSDRNVWLYEERENHGI